VVVGLDARHHQRRPLRAPDGGDAGGQRRRRERRQCRRRAPIEVFVVDPHRAKVARARFGSTTVQLRADELDCVSETHLTVRVQAGRGGLLVSPGAVLRSARVSISRSRVLRRSRWATLVDLRSQRATRTARVRLVPRHGRSRTLRLPVRACGRVP
jgi:hypothetical protein